MTDELKLSNFITCAEDFHSNFGIIPCKYLTRNYYIVLKMFAGPNYSGHVTSPHQWQLNSCKRAFYDPALLPTVEWAEILRGKGMTSEVAAAKVLHYVSFV